MQIRGKLELIHFSLLLKEKDMIRLSRSADAKGTNLIGRVFFHFFFNSYARVTKYLQMMPLCAKTSEFNTYLQNLLLLL
jgi:hypothetical protein